MTNQEKLQRLFNVFGFEVKVTPKGEFTHEESNKKSRFTGGSQLRHDSTARDG